jgi:hypothetical protein
VLFNGISTAPGGPVMITAAAPREQIARPIYARGRGGCFWCYGSARIPEKAAAPV